MYRHDKMNKQYKGELPMNESAVREKKIEINCFESQQESIIKALKENGGSLTADEFDRNFAKYYCDGGKITRNKPFFMFRTLFPKYNIEHYDNDSRWIALAWLMSDVGLISIEKINGENKYFLKDGGGHE